MSELCRKQKNQRWTWYAAERSCGIILAWHNCRRTDESCRRLMEKLSVFPIKYYHTDNWKSYSRYIPSGQHIIGKKNGSLVIRVEVIM
ncbi:IS1 family transposase [Desulfonema ishimotonii]|uniref:IS1 family transposase n=1 Tax=Desulfonema ishimotonii TaxID=45657 RepID=UPI000F568F13